MSAPTVTDLPTTYAVLRIVAERLDLRPTTWAEHADLLMVRDDIVRELSVRGQPAWVIALRGRLPLHAVRAALTSRTWRPWGVPR